MNKRLYFPDNIENPCVSFPGDIQVLIERAVNAIKTAVKIFKRVSGLLSFSGNFIIGVAFLILIDDFHQRIQYLALQKLQTGRGYAAFRLRIV